jgi:hypothetical protein
VKLYTSDWCKRADFQFLVVVSPVFVLAIFVFPSRKNSVYILVRRTAIFCGKEISSSAPGRPDDLLRVSS